MPKTALDEEDRSLFARTEVFYTAWKNAINRHGDDSVEAAEAYKQFKPMDDALRERDERLAAARLTNPPTPEKKRGKKSV